MSQSLMDLIDELVRIESQDPAEFDYVAGVWSGSDEARAARAAVEARIQAIRQEALRVGIDGDDILTALNGDDE